MLFDPITKTLYTDSGEKIKQLHCNVNQQWDDLTVIEGFTDTKHCDYCQQNIIDTAAMSDDFLLQLLQKNPETCLKISFNQPNLLLL